MLFGTFCRDISSSVQFKTNVTMEYLEGIPNILYKYRDYSNKYNQRTLFDFELFLASTSMFNDPYEGSIPFEYDPAELTEDNIFLKLRSIAKERHPEWDEQRIQEFCFEGQQKDLLNDEKHKEYINKKNKEQIETIFGILSLTKHPMNYLMWSHYAKSHTGFCIGFDKFILFEHVQGSIGLVNYAPKVPRLKLFEDIGAFHVKQLGTKSDVWSYEDEYRIVKSNAANQTLNYPKEMIKNIFLGCKMKQTEKNKIIEFVSQNKIECEIYELTLDKEIFKLNDSRIY